ncbi:creatinine amidohydrolase [Reticulibacter mediterranei]|uniref:Creatinine amidohydrolase n=1 Tax=Reticulibacter mediterranei TaxID=2778369 RepID=A0A8J3IYH8_9CHLR|nr:creatininase family protein [Reticulibacter mediterranei]GHP00821.1 creatinine amidohydrolase [Reticulibacter mediterranei]
MDTSNAAPSFRGLRRKIVVLPVGSCEQHGPFLPIDTDLRIAQLLAGNLEQSFGKEETLLLPAIPFSCSYEHSGLGTLALQVSTLAALLHDMARSLKAWDMPVLLLLVNWHGGNDVLATLATEISATENIHTAVIPSIAAVARAWDESKITGAKDVHAGAVEVSIVQAYWPHLVPESLPAAIHFEPNIAPAKTQAILQALGSYAVTRDGTWGAPEQADPAKGKILIELMVQSMHEQAKALLDLVNRHAQRGNI